MDIRSVAMDSRSKDILAAWRTSPKEPVSRACVCSEKGRILQESIEQRGDLFIRYNGGSSPGSKRTVRPERLFSKWGEDYLDAYCLTRKESRCFKLDRLEIVSATGGKEKDYTKKSNERGNTAIPVTPRYPTTSDRDSFAFLRMLLPYIIIFLVMLFFMNPKK